MKSMADGAQQAGGKIIGISLEIYKQNVRQGADEMIIAKTFGERKALFIERSLDLFYNNVVVDYKKDEVVVRIAFDELRGKKLQLSTRDGSYIRVKVISIHKSFFGPFLGVIIAEAEGLPQDSGASMTFTADHSFAPSEQKELIDYTSNYTVDHVSPGLFGIVGGHPNWLRFEITAVQIL
jgi:hypothetical protein